MRSHFTVKYEPELENDLADRWVQADAAGRKWLTRVGAEIDHQLKLRADELGVPVDNQPQLRLWTLQVEFQPVSVTFRVEPEDYRVRVVLIRFHRGNAHYLRYLTSPAAPESSLESYPPHRCSRR